MAVLAVSRGNLAHGGQPLVILAAPRSAAFILHLRPRRSLARCTPQLRGCHLQEWLQMSTPNYLDAVAYASHGSSTISAMRGRFATSRTKMRRINRSLPSLNTNGMRKSPSIISSTL